MHTTTILLTISHEGELPKGLLAALEAKAYDFTMAHGVACGEVVAKESPQPPEQPQRGEAVVITNGAWRHIEADTICDLIEKHRAYCSKDTETFKDEALHQLLRDVVDAAAAAQPPAQPAQSKPCLDCESPTDCHSFMKCLKYDDQPECQATPTLLLPVKEMRHEI